jgi:eukaryotic-like serine/threonine-protein kinase
MSDDALSDLAIHRLQAVLNEPDLSGTRYRLVRAAGRGGMGVVFEAEDSVLKRHVALKVIQPAEAYLDPASADRLLEEARVLARLEHPGIVPVHDAGVLPDGNIFYTMKYVDGRRLDAYSRTDVSLADLLRVFQKICETVGFAHAQDVIHCDLKPENIMVGMFGEVLVLDWGVAKVLHRSEPAGSVIGTPEYMAPEQARGEVERIDKRTDVFALGAILQFLIRTRDAPKPLRAVCAMARSINPDNRYANADELSREVDRYLDGAPVHAYRENLIERTVRIVVNNPLAFALIAAYLAMRILVFLLLRR